jgi:polysaccharide deacetylase family protein (PEP-CTERM system associated)
LRNAPHGLLSIDEQSTQVPTEGFSLNRTSGLRRLDWDSSRSDGRFECERAIVRKWAKPQNPTLVDGLSVDLEDYFHVEAFASHISRSRWPSFTSRIRRNTARVLELLERSRCRATFFVLGWVAEREPDLIREIAQAGHELACHSHLHRLLYRLSPGEFRDDLRRSRGIIEDVSGAKVVGFRAPTFSITRKSLWALEILAEEGFQYDSSIFPIRHDRYGIPGAARWVHQRSLPSGQSIWEIPPSTVRIAGMNLPFGGGGYLRLLPMFFTRWAIRTTHQREGQPVMVYFHPWELDPDQPRLPGTWKSRFRHCSGLAKTEGRLQEILALGRFQPFINLVQMLEGYSPVANHAALVSTNQQMLRPTAS